MVKKHSIRFTILLWCSYAKSRDAIFDRLYTSNNQKWFGRLPLSCRNDHWSGDTNPADV